MIYTYSCPRTKCGEGATSDVEQELHIWIEEHMGLHATIDQIKADMAKVDTA